MEDREGAPGSDPLEPALQGSSPLAAREAREPRPQTRGPESTGPTLRL